MINIIHGCRGSINGTQDRRLGVIIRAALCSFRSTASRIVFIFFLGFSLAFRSLPSLALSLSLFSSNTVQFWLWLLCSVSFPLIFYAACVCAYRIASQSLTCIALHRLASLYNHLNQTKSRENAWCNEIKSIV